MVGYREISSESSLNLYLFSKIIIVGSPLWPVSSLTMGSWLHLLGSIEKSQIRTDGLLFLKWSVVLTSWTWPQWWIQGANIWKMAYWKARWKKHIPLLSISHQTKQISMCSLTTKGTVKGCFTCNEPEWTEMELEQHCSWSLPHCQMRNRRNTQKQGWVWRRLGGGGTDQCCYTTEDEVTCPHNRVAGIFI